MQNARAIVIQSLIAGACFLRCVALASAGGIDFQVIHDLGGPARPDAAFLAINNRDDLISYVNKRSSLLPSVTEGSPQIPRIPPTIDFEKYTLLVFSKGPSTGHYLFISGIREYDTEIRAAVFDMSVGPGCAVPQMVTYPTALALIPHTMKPIRFQLTVATYECRIPEDHLVAAPSNR